MTYREYIWGLPYMPCSHILYILYNGTTNGR
nr:MAG TPA: hypothetical protein [Bacteriophage sp.]